MQSSMDVAGRQAGDIKSIWTLMLWICGVMYALVLAFLGWALWRARRRLAGPPTVEGVESAADRPMQRVLGGWIGLIVLGLLVLTFGSFLVDRQLATAANRADINIRVTANQWWWEVEYQDPDPSRSFVTANEIHLPVGKTAKIELVATDVIHSFWIPNLGGKQDLIPGRKNDITLTPMREGRYRGQCAEFCGLQHSNMALDVMVDSEAGYEAWRARQMRSAPAPATPAQAHGLDVFQTQACANCHQIDGTEAKGQTGPNLTHVASRRYIAAGVAPYSRGTLAAWIADPQGLKPGAHMPIVQLSPADLNGLLDYLDSLK
ncbi:cytochrome c oxidase subunit II [Phenylobacterium sp. VNQ135]|uniref:cytochrome c oxidase subunit II n=1 Tax=Phenylobacterium sp. VNQ135 TaxID=3400922 RepID=UPI003BFDF662